MENRIEAIIFDAGGVLFSIRETREAIIERVLESKGYDSVEITKAIESAREFDSSYFQENTIVDWHDERKWLKSRCGKIVEHLPFDSVLEDQLFHLTLDTFQYTLYTETLTVLNSLKDKVPLFVLSNATATLDWAFDYLGIRKFFREIIISSYVGDVKPNLSIFNLATTQFGLNPRSTLFIDDKAEHIEAANKSGFISIHLEREKGQTLEVISTML